MRIARWLAVGSMVACGDGSGSGDTSTTPPPSSTGTAACSDPSANPLSGTCVETFLAGCFDPAGACTSAQTGLNSTLTWDNGASVTTQAGMTTTTTISASDGTECATGLTEINVDGCFSETTYRRPDGATQTWCFHQDTSFEVTCDDGTVIPVAAGQSDSATSCQYGGQTCG